MVPGIEGPGLLRSLTVANPAAGVDWTQAAPTNGRWFLRGGTATLLTSAAIANRQVALVIDDGASTLFTIEAAAVQAAGATVVYDLIPGDTLTALTATHQPVIIPRDLRLLAGWRVRTSTGLLQAGDQWSAIQLMLEEWIED